MLTAEALKLEGYVPLSELTDTLQRGSIVDVATGENGGYDAFCRGLIVGGVEDDSWTDRQGLRHVEHTLYTDRERFGSYLDVLVKVVASAGSKEQVVGAALEQLVGSQDLSPDFVKLVLNELYEAAQGQGRGEAIDWDSSSLYC